MEGGILMKKKKNKDFIYEDDFIIPESQNSNEQVDKKNFKNKKVIIGALIALGVSVVAATFIFVDTGFIGQYKSNFKQNISAIDDALGLSGIFESYTSDDVDVKISETAVKVDIGSTFEQNSYMLPFENASLSAFSLCNKGLAVAKSNYLGVYDSHGKIVWETQTNVIDPILRTEGEFTLIAEKGSTKICLYQNDTLLFTVDDPNEIITAQLSQNGDIVLVTKKEFYKNAVSVYNKNGEQIFSWSSGTDTIINADISKSTRRIALSLLNTDERVKSYIMMFDINQTKPYHTVEFTESVIFNTRFIGETLNLTGDNRLTGLAVDGDVVWDNLYPDSSLVFTSCDNYGNKAVVLDTNNIPEIAIYDEDGHEDDRFKLDVLPDYIDINGRSILYNAGRIVNFGKAGKLHQYIASMDIMGLKAIRSDAFVIIYNNSLEFVKAK